MTNEQLQLASIKKISDVVLANGEKLAEARSIIDAFDSDYQASKRLVPSVVEKLAACHDIEGVSLVPDTLRKQAENCLDQHAGALNLLGQLAEKYAQLAEHVSDMQNVKTAAPVIGSGISKSSSYNEIRDGNEQLREQAMDAWARATAH